MSLGQLEILQNKKSFFFWEINSRVNTFFKKTSFFIHFLAQNFLSFIYLCYQFYGQLRSQKIVSLGAGNLGSIVSWILKCVKLLDLCVSKKKFRTIEGVGLVWVCISNSIWNICIFFEIQIHPLLLPLFVNITYVFT